MKESVGMKSIATTDRQSPIRSLGTLRSALVTAQRSGDGKSDRFLGYDPASLPRELNRHYIAADDDDIASMLATVGADSLEEVFSHLPPDCLFQDLPSLPEEMPYQDIQNQLEAIAGKNSLKTSFLGDGLPHYEVPEIVPFVASIRNLTTTYTPYQPERSQGTLMSHWIYQCLMSMLTGFEAINSSLYDRATAIYEAICASIRLSRSADTAIVPEALFPGDMEVLETLATDTAVRIVKLPLDPSTGCISLQQLQSATEEFGDSLACVVFPQINSLGLLEGVDSLTDLCRNCGARSIAVVDPVLLSTGGLKPPSEFGASGVDFVVGEAQHLATPPNFGGPGLGLFGVRFDARHGKEVRVTPGRYVGKAKDLSGRDCRVMVLSTREQHIRREKATSNICSNQAFIATAVGAAILARGESGMASACRKGREQARRAVERITSVNGLSLAFPQADFFNEFVVEVPEPTENLIEKGTVSDLHIGVDVSDRITSGRRNLLKISFSDRDSETEKLAHFFQELYGSGGGGVSVSEIPRKFLRTQPVGLPQLEIETIKSYYQKLGELNVSPDDACYPLGSCTMKYNPYLNDWAASLPGFQEIHPQAPIEDAQGSLEVLYEIQEWFKGITGLAAVTTQPVAGAQGELVGLKLFQAYHRDQGNDHRDIIFIPETAHGTNFATATMASFGASFEKGEESGIVLLRTGKDGAIDLADLRQKVSRYSDRICGIMCTNPNTSGIFEKEFKTIANCVHQAGGLVFMDGANLNAIAGWVDLGTAGVDAVHSNLHKTWTIPHGGGGPGDAIVAVSERLVDFLPGMQIEKKDDRYSLFRPPKSIGSFHRHWGNFGHKVRCYTYLLRLGREGIRRMSAIAVLSARYLYENLRRIYPTLPDGAENIPRMHEFILSLEPSDFERLEKVAIPRAVAITRLGKLFLDFGFHTPTVAWPEAYGVMIEPTESYSKMELDRFVEALKAILKLVRESPETLVDTPYFTPVDRIDEVEANRNLCLSETLTSLPPLHENRIPPRDLAQMSIDEISDRIIAATSSNAPPTPQ